MHCNDLTDELDDGASRVQTTYSDFAVVSLGIVPGIKGSGQSTLGGMLHTMSAARVDSNGNPQPVVNLFNIIDTRGCPNDGNLNWRGDH